MKRSARAAGRRRRPDGLLVAAVLFFGIFGLPGFAFAWGPSVHLWIGDQVLQGVIAIAPALYALLRRHARSYLYGSLAPDFEVGKGSTYHDGHNHNWSSGRQVFESAETDSQKAFAYGYLSHLAADVIGHNHFVPNNLYRSFGSKKLGHAYWEMHADNVIDDGAYAELGALLVSTPQPENDALVARIAEQGIIPFEAKKRLFTSFLRLSNHSRARRFLDRVRPFSVTSLRHDDVRDQVDLSLACVIEMLRDPSVPLLGRYDPIGARNICLAKELRRETRRAHTFSKGDVPFPIPAELRALRRHLEVAPAAV